MSSRSEPLQHQFEPHGEGFLYRRYPSSAPVRVSADEYHAYVEDYRQWMGWFFAIGFALFVGGVLAAMIWARDLFDPMAPLKVGFAWVVVAMGAWASYRVIHAPAGDDAALPAPGQLRFADEMRHNRLANLSYWQLSLAVPFAIVAVAYQTPGPGALPDWTGLAAGVAILCPAAIQAFRKWRAEQAR